MRLVGERVPVASKIQAWDRWMPPAGQESDYVGRQYFGQRVPQDRPGTANRRHRKAQKGVGVAEALDSWGEWRNWQDDDITRSYTSDPYDRTSYPLYRQQAWEVAPEQRMAWEGDAMWDVM